MVSPERRTMILDEIAAIHDSHECHRGPCVCRCGCTDDAGCRVVFGPLCSGCIVRVGRGDCEHGEEMPDGWAGGIRQRASNAGGRRLRIWRTARSSGARRTRRRVAWSDKSAMDG